MLKIQEIREIIKLIDQSSIEKFTFESEGTKIKLEKGNSNAHVQTEQKNAEPVKQETPATQEVKQDEPKQEKVETTNNENISNSSAAAVDPSLHKITSPMVGTFYQSSSPDTPSYVKKGDSVSPEKIVCIVEAMKLFNEIEAEVSGEIVEILVEDGQLVEYGQPLFLVKQN
ncbi:acetyl-CoA carboxylase biotin carboxyl carrier protein [Sporosarcina thermotolerans]|uniref:Biotin carboxyl carrier protein of acetyl-CoA carboxylase n=1 Tax=Sporosarcina thermotolerans TaxID=633404 RepID=A0AAW9A6W4_9BACL|nr:acetyl-CoA carboxylase biotin carboxyl carrier protein [Sporosarcina thermotolerans]MDW0117316.1 acetyl-CoA carboxylase biotin carboxyl carrier protein [Sporosarcina thermotolerans]WHT47468.1 acetyl-CoA carboxylase biotin carboxyl carrier protein [Sporosarcina thermotolerans]